MTAPLAIVSMSGGKDSLATALVAIERYGRERVRLVFADTGHEHPLTTEYVHDYLPGALGLPVQTVRADFSRQIAGKRTFIKRNWEYMGVPLPRIDRALEALQPTGNPFLDLCMWKGRFPSRKAQFCTQELKRRPLDGFMFALAEELGGQSAIESWQGVRRDESLNRRDALEWEAAAEGWMIHRPLVDWTAADVFAIAALYCIRPNPLYSQGMSRVGCMPCINTGKDELHEIGRRFPAEIARVREWEAIVSECAKRSASTLFHGDAVAGEVIADTALRLGITSQVAWAATSRGGKQFDMLRAIPSPACSSIYGLCE